MADSVANRSLKYRLVRCLKDMERTLFCMFDNQVSAKKKKRQVSPLMHNLYEEQINPSSRCQASRSVSHYYPIGCPRCKGKTVTFYFFYSTDCIVVDFFFF